MTSPSHDDVRAAVARLVTLGGLHDTVPLGQLHDSTRGLFPTVPQVYTERLSPTTSPADIDLIRLRDIVQRCQARNEILMCDEEHLNFKVRPGEQGLEYAYYTGTPLDNQVLACQHAIADAILAVNPKAQWGFYGCGSPITAVPTLSYPVVWAASEKMVPLFAPVQAKATHFACTMYWDHNHNWDNWFGSTLWEVGQALTYGKPILAFLLPMYSSSYVWDPLPDLLWRQLLMFARRFGLQPTPWGNSGTDPNSGVPLPHDHQWTRTVREVFGLAA